MVEGKLKDVHWDDGPIIVYKIEPGLLSSPFNRELVFYFAGFLAGVMAAARWQRGS